MRDAAIREREEAEALRDSGDIEGAIATYRAMIARFSAYHGLEIRLPVAAAMADLGGILFALGCHEESVAVMDALLAREDDSNDPALVQQCERARLTIAACNAA